MNVDSVDSILFSFFQVIALKPGYYKHVFLCLYIILDFGFDFDRFDAQQDNSGPYDVASKKFIPPINFLFHCQKLVIKG